MQHENLKILLLTLACFLSLNIIFTPKVLALTLGMSIPEKYTEIATGEKLYFQTDIKWPENDTRKDLRIEYSIKDKNSQEIAYLKVLKAVETQASFIDSINIPEGTSKGLHTITAKVSDYDDLNQEVAVSFNVKRAGQSIEMLLFLIIGILGIVVAFLIAEIFIFLRRSPKAIR